MAREDPRTRPGATPRPAVSLGGTAAALSGLALFAGLVHGIDEEAVRLVVRGTAKIAVTLFSLAFATSSLHAIGRSDATKWLLRNRRYLGLSFALAHAGHLLALGALAIWFPRPFVDDLDPLFLIGGGLAYAFLFAMAATSSDAAFRKLGARRWRGLHTAGSYYIWGVFAFSYLPRVTESAEYVVYAALLAIALSLRMARRFRGSRAFA